jgi:Zn-finger nucleic acid-binding protein
MRHNRSMSDFSCPKCHAPMRTHRRNGVTIEQCTECHGVFLDRGELEQLIGVESSFLGADPVPPLQAKRSD